MTRDTLKRQILHSYGAGFRAIGIFGLCTAFCLFLPQKPPLADSFTDGLGRRRQGAEGAAPDRAASVRMLITGGRYFKAICHDICQNHRQKAIFTCCVELDATAADTKGNAVAARKWAELPAIQPVSGHGQYHMPRALLY